MAQVRVTARVDPAAVRAFIEGQVVDALMRGGGKVRDLAKANITAAGRVDKGQMRNAIVVEVARIEGNRIVVRVTAETAHAGFQHEGTGVHGPRGAPIVPRRARVLRFKPAGSSVFIFRPEVAGVEGVPFLTDALAELDASDLT